MEHNLKNAGDFYRKVQIPKQLSSRVERAIEKADKLGRKVGFIKPWIEEMRLPWVPRGSGSSNSHTETDTKEHD